MAHRQCFQNSAWGTPNVSECRTPEIFRLEKLLLTEAESLSSDNVTEFAVDLSNTLKTSQQIFPSDLSSIANILDIIIL